MQFEVKKKINKVGSQINSATVKFEDTYCDVDMYQRNNAAHQCNLECQELYIHQRQKDQQFEIRRRHTDHCRRPRRGDGCAMI